MNILTFFVATFLCLTYVEALNTVLSPPYTCTTTICHPGDTIERPAPSVSGSQGRPGKRGVAGFPGPRGEKGDPCQCDVADEEALREMEKKMDELTSQNQEVIQKLDRVESENQQMNRTINKLEGYIDQLVFPSNCMQSRMTDKIYPWKEDGNLTAVEFNCALYSEDEAGWITIQKRRSGNVRFYDRNWESYAKGFGDKYEEFWLGLRTIHQLTSTKNYKLRIDLTFKSGSVKYVEYSTFKVASEGSKFRLTISGYSGNAEDMMTYHNGQYFSTSEVDNDIRSGSCAQEYQGAWWYRDCFHSNLNGKYDVRFDWPYTSLLSSSEMKIHPA